MWVFRKLRSHFKEIPLPVISKLDDHGNQLHLTDYICGYPGTGPHVTLEILNKAGIRVDKKIVFYAQAFSFPYSNEL
ncbi:hypothetical protein [Bacillus mycoides]|uniref:hypothetical protein n=1 Tax=Bacillus mycoides TaxID=1405 RepID=UPI003A7F8AD8